MQGPWCRAQRLVKFPGARPPPRTTLSYRRVEVCRVEEVQVREVEEEEAVLMLREA